jgi:pantothenate kinase
VGEGDLMEQRTEQEVSPYRVFSRAEWATLREDTPMTLVPEEIARLRSVHDRLDISEVEEIYLPLSRLLSLYVAATQRLFRAQQGFLGTEDAKMPYIIGVGGSVAAGKSTTARVLQALLARWPNVPQVDLITTDGFLYPNAVLERERLMEKKGFPESYDLPGLLRFLSDIKAGPRMARPFRSSRIFSTFRSISTPTRTCCCRGTSAAFWRCAAQLSPIPNRIFIATRNCPTRRRWSPPHRSGTASTSSICAKTFCPRARAPI